MNIKLLAKFFSKQRRVDDKDLETLYHMDDIWKNVYEENRIELSFSDARILANKEVIKFIYENRSNKDGL